MKKTTQIPESKLQLNKITLMRLDAGKLSKIAGGFKGKDEENVSTRPECGHSQEPPRPSFVKDTL